MQSWKVFDVCMRMQSWSVLKDVVHYTKALYF